MKWATKAVVIGFVSSFIVPLSVFAADDDAKARGQFEAMLAGINENSFERIKTAIDKDDLTGRIYGVRLVEVEVKRVFNDNFWTIVEGAFSEGMASMAANADGEIISFEFKDGKGQAIVRYALPKYAYAYQVWDLRHDRRARLKIIDWQDSNIGQNFSAHVGEALVTIMPSKAATRKLLSIRNPTDAQLFQVTEILKAARDQQPPRFFEIYDGLEPELQKEALIAKFAVKMAYTLKDPDRFDAMLNNFVEVYGRNPGYALLTADYHLVIERYQNAYASLQQFHQNFDMTEGATPARLSALALALGKIEDAEKYAQEAISDEPTLELGWWSLLRARTRAEDFQGAIEAMARLEDDFGRPADVAVLKRDPFRAFGDLVESQEYKDWRAGRQ